MFGDNFNINNYEKKLIEFFKKTNPDYANLSDAEILSIMNTRLDDVKISEDEKISAFWDINNTDFVPNKITKSSNEQTILKDEIHSFSQIAGNRLKSVKQEIKKAEDKNGFIGKAWSGFKNLTGIGDGSDKVRELQKQEIDLLNQFNTKPYKRAEIFKKLTGLDYNKENINKFINGEVKLKSETALYGYTEGQGMASDIAGDLVSGIAAVGLYSLAVASVPVTGGLTLAAAGIVGASSAIIGGGFIKTGLKYADAKTGGREYTSKNRDFATGAFSGLLAPLTAGLGGAVGKTVATKLGIEVLKQGTKQGIKTGAKQSLKTAILNPAGYSYGGAAGKQVLSYGAEMASDGAVGGSIDMAFRTAYDGGDVNDVLIAGAEGGIGGLFFAPLMGGGFKLMGKTGHFLGKLGEEKSNVEKSVFICELDTKNFKKLDIDKQLSPKQLSELKKYMPSKTGKVAINNPLLGKLKTAMSKTSIANFRTIRLTSDEVKNIAQKVESSFLKENPEVAEKIIKNLSEITSTSSFTKFKYYKFKDEDIIEILNLTNEKNITLLEKMLKTNTSSIYNDASQFLIIFKSLSSMDEKLALKIMNMFKNCEDLSYTMADNVYSFITLAEKYTKEFTILSSDFHPNMTMKMLSEKPNDLEILIKRMQSCTDEEKELIKVLYSPAISSGSNPSAKIIELLDANLNLNNKQLLTLFEHFEYSAMGHHGRQKALDKLKRTGDNKLSVSKECVYKKDAEMTKDDMFAYLLHKGVPQDVCESFCNNDLAEVFVRLFILDDAFENILFGGMSKSRMVTELLKVISKGNIEEELDQISLMKSISSYLNTENIEIYKSNHKNFIFEDFMNDLNDNITSVESYSFCSAYEKITKKPAYEKDMIILGTNMVKLIGLGEQDISGAVSKLKELNLLKEDSNLMTLLTKTKELSELNVTPELKEFAEFVSKNKYIEESSVIDFLHAVQSSNKQILSAKINFAKKLIENMECSQDSAITMLKNLSSKNLEILNKQISILKNIKNKNIDLMILHSKFLKTDNLEEFNSLNNILEIINKNYSHNFWTFNEISMILKQNEELKTELTNFITVLLNKKISENNLSRLLGNMQIHCQDNMKEFISLYLKGMETNLDALNGKFEEILFAKYTNTKNLDLRQKIKLYENLSTVNDEGKAILKQLGINYDSIYDKIINSIGFKRSTVVIPAKQSQIFIKNIIANNNPKADKILQNFNFEQFGKKGLPLKYPRAEFNLKVEELLKDIPENEKELILKHFGLEKGTAGFDGLPNNTPFSSTKASEKAIAAAKKVQKEIDKFTLNNEVLISDAETKEVLDGLIKGLPEFTSIVGKEQHGTHAYSVDIHTLKVLQSAMNDPIYKTLSDQDKTILKYSILLHDLGKKGGVIDKGHASLSADYTWSILDRYPFPAGVKDRIIDIVDNHHWFEAYNTGTASAENIAVRCRRPEDIKIYEIFSKADFENVNPTFHLGEKTGGATNKAEFDAYMQAKFNDIEKAVNKIYQKANFIFDSQFMHNGKLFPTKKVKIDGKTAELKVLNFSELKEGADLSVYGFAPEVTRDNARFVVHMTEPKLSSLETVFRLTETPVFQSTWSSSLVRFSNNQTYWGKNYGVIFDIPQANYSEAFWGNTHSGGAKTLDEFRSFLFGSRVIKKEDMNGKTQTWDVRHFVKNNFIQEMEQKGYNLSELEYASLSEYLFGKKYISQIRKDIQVGNTVIRAKDLTDALEKSRDALFYGDEHSELIPINPKIKGVFAKVEKIEDCPNELLKFAQEHDLPIILMKPQKPKQKNLKLNLPKLNVSKLKNNLEK